MVKSPFVEPDEAEVFQGIVSQIAHRLVKQKATLMVAESATGGLIQHLITETPGSSDFYEGGVVAYANELKHRLLQVPEPTTKRFGSVSAETVAAMANGVRLWMNSDYGLATSGIAGPTKGKSSKPIGLVYVAVSHRSFETITEEYQFTGTRRDNKLNFSRAALTLLLDCIIQEE
jgi:PncC family amidohydrolase